MPSSPPDPLAEPPHPEIGNDPSPPLRPLLDGAAGSVELSRHGDDLRLIAADCERDLDERLDALEDLRESEVGDTLLTRARNLERRYGIRQLFLKFDGSNPSGTQKDRIAFAQAEDALRRGFTGLTVATCGNYGAAVALACSAAGLDCLVVMPGGYHSARDGDITAAGATIEQVPGDYEAAVVASSRLAIERDFYDANPGGDNTLLQLKAYGEIAAEIYDELRDAPAGVAVPVSNGTTLAGIHRGFRSLDRRGKTSRMPRMIAGSSFRKNPIVRSWERGLELCEDLDPATIRETVTNEPLINWHSIDGQLALDAIRGTGGWASPATDKAMRAMAKTIREEEGLSVLPASTAGLLALLEHHLREPLPGDRYVAVLTGRSAR